MPDPSQIFQTESASRWKRLLWSSRLLLFLVLLAGGFVYFSYRTMIAPTVPVEARVMKKMLNDKLPSYRESKLARQYRGIRQFIEGKWKDGDGCGQHGLQPNLSSSHLFQDDIGIRAAFYVGWDAQSFFSLQRNISKVNLVLPEWFFLDPNADTLVVRIDDRALKLIQKAGVQVMPMLTNNINSIWRGDVVHRIINDKTKRERLINDVIRSLQVNGFSGVNIDFEELVETQNEVLTNFQKELYQKLHAQKLLVTQDVSPFNEDYDYRNLALSNDYLFLMAYDQHHGGTKPGPVSSQRWIESAVDQMTKYVAPNKIVLGVAGYGYDWGAGTTETVTYQQALSTARESEGEVQFDEDTYNAYYEYYDGKDSLHQVHFTDAATTFNTLRFITEYGLAGAALWRLGAEDMRMWDFYNKPMTKQALQHFNFAEFNKVEGNNDVDYIGEGEILDIVASPTDGHITPEIDTAAMLISAEHYDKLPSVYVIKKFGKSSAKKLVLTYDDGPDPLYTKQILDTLSSYHVPATFFIVGIEAENNVPLVKRIYDEGHEIGNHTFTHPNMALVSARRASIEMDATQLLIECITGHSTVMFRAPFNADSEPGSKEELVPIAMSRKKNYLTIGESVDPQDWERAAQPTMNGDTLLNRTVRIYNYHVNELQDSAHIILLHDAGGDRSATVEATGKIIRYFTARGYTFTTVADLLHKTKEDMMPAVPKGSGYYLLQFNYFLALIGYYLSRLFETLFTCFMIASGIRLAVLGYFALKRRKQLKQMVYPLITHTNAPAVSIIVPAYNEEVNVVSSINNLLKCDYLIFDIVFVDDGSTDATYEQVKKTFAHDERVKIFAKENGGKASALNFGIQQSDAPYVICIDADTKLLPDAVTMLMRHFINADEKIGAVAGNVRVGNQVNMMTRWQSIEYITSQNFDRKAFAYINAIAVVPGAIGAFSKEAIKRAGGFTTDTLAEDCDLTMRILNAGFKVTEESKAIALTEAPETVHQFMKQRFRWTFGVMQAFWKHRESLFSSKHIGLGWVALPDMLLFKYIIPFFSPVADLLMLIGLLTGNAEKIGWFYLVFILVDSCIAALAFAIERENIAKLIWIIPQRLVYRWLMLIVLFRSIRRAIKGEMQHWGVLKRTGNVKEVMQAG